MVASGPLSVELARVRQAVGDRVMGGEKRTREETSGRCPQARLHWKKKRVSGLSNWMKVGLDKTNRSMQYTRDMSHVPAHHTARLFFKPRGHPGRKDLGTAPKGNGANLQHGSWRGHQDPDTPS